MISVLNVTVGNLDDDLVPYCDIADSDDDSDY